MRILVDDPDRIPRPLYRRFHRRALFRGLMAGTETTAAGSYLGLNALVLAESELASLAELSACFARVFEKAGRQVAEDVDLLAAFGFPWSFAELLRQEPVRAVAIGRFDFLLDDRGHWQLVEYNSDTPSGIREATAVDEIAFHLLRPYFRGRRANEQLSDRIVAGVQSILPRRHPVRVGFLTDASHLEDIGQAAFVERLVRTAAAPGEMETVLGDIDNLSWSSRQGVALLGRPIDALYRYYPFEAMLARPQFQMIAEAATAGRLRLINGLRGLLLQNKGLLAWIWAHRGDPLFAEAERAAIVGHLPPTWWVGDLPAEVNRRQTVVKQVFGREGEEVYLGEVMSDEDWERCRQWQTFIVQQRVESAPLRAVSWDLQGQPVPKQRWPAVGSFVCGGQWSGCYTRLGDRIVTVESEFVPTFGEGK